MTQQPQKHKPSKTAPASPSGALPLGKPPRDEERSPLTKITFKADDETLAALAILEQRLGPAVRTTRSSAIRGAIQSAAAGKGARS